MRAAYIRLGLVLVIVLLTSAAIARNPSCVGDYGNPDRLVINGCKLITPEALKAAVTVNLEILLAAHPAAPLDSYRDMLRDKILTGYQHSGFPDARVSIHIDRQSERIHIHIEEGRQYSAGKIVIKGNRNIPATSIIKWLLSPCPPAGSRLDGIIEQGGKTVHKWVDKDGKQVDLEKPIWKTGQAATFDKITIQRIRARTRRAFSDLGFFFPVFHVNVVPENNGNKASLVIQIFVEGSKALLGEINVVGNKNNSPKEIADYLDMKPGKPFTGEQLTAWNEKLWRSGRFVKSQVSIAPPPSGSDKAKLDILLVESPWAPRLSEPLSPEQVILLKLRECLANPQRWDSDLYISAKSDSGMIVFVISPKHGMLCKLIGKTKTCKGLSQPVDFAFVLSNKLSCMSCPKPLDAKLWGSPTKSSGVRFIGSLGMCLNHDPEDVEHPRKVMLGFGAIHNNLDGNHQPFQFNINVAPAFFVALPNIGKDVKCNLNNGVLTLVDTNGRYRVDAVSGRLLEYVAIDGESGKPIVNILFQAGAYKKHLADIQSAAADCPNNLNNDAPFASLLTFLCTEKLACLYTNEPRIHRLLHFARAMHRKKTFVSNSKLSQQIDRWFFSRLETKEEFAIPVGMTASVSPNVTPTNHYLLLCGLVLIDRTFPRQTWPWTFSREVMLSLSGQTQYTTDTLQNLLTSNDNGPIFYLVAASTIERFSPQYAKRFAAEGVSRLSGDYFQKDCLVLLNKDCEIGRYIRQMAIAIRKLTPLEVEELLNQPSSDDCLPLRKWVERLRSQPERPAEDVLLEVLTAAWNAGLREQVKSKLSKIRDATSEI